MIAERLRKAVLKAAMEGKLTYQLDNDENAIKLIAQIKKQKENLVKLKKIRPDKETKSLENIKVEKIIPKNWVLTRLGEIANYKKGPFGSSLTKSMFVPKSDSTIKVYEQKNAIQKSSEIGDYYIKKQYYEDKMTGFIVEPGDIIISCAGTIGEIYQLPLNAESGIINQALMRVRLFDGIDSGFFSYLFTSMLNEIHASSSGSAIKNIPPFSILKNILILLPPYKEQKRIVEKLEVLLAEIDKLEQDEKALKELEDKFPEKLKESILQNAFEGKFTESLETDSNVDDFIDELKSKQKIKSTEYIIETPFNIPSSWRWDKVGNIFYKIFSHRTPKYSNIRNENFILGQRNNQDYGLDLENIKYGTSEYWESIREDMFLEKNDVLLNTLGGGTVGRSGIFNLKGKYITDGHLFIFRSGNDYLQKYFLYYLQLKRKEIEKGASGSTNQIFLRLKDVKEYLIPIPPYDELKRIVDKLDNLFALYF